MSLHRCSTARCATRAFSLLCPSLSGWNVSRHCEHRISMTLNKIGTFSHDADTPRTRGRSALCWLRCIGDASPPMRAPLTPRGMAKRDCSAKGSLRQRGARRDSHFCAWGRPSGSPAGRCRRLVEVAQVEQAHGLHILGVIDQHPPLGGQALHRSEAMAPKSSALMITADFCCTAIQRWVNVGARFSRKAFMPSWASSLAKRACNWRRSKPMPSASGPS